MSGEAAAFARRLASSGLTPGELQTALMVSQSTVSRLLHGKISNVQRHAAALDRSAVDAGGDVDLEEALMGLRAAARLDPTLRRVIVDLSRIMQKA